jgi:hypothetical protein
MPGKGNLNLHLQHCWWHMLRMNIEERNVNFRVAKDRLPTLHTIFGRPVPDSEKSLA